LKVFYQKSDRETDRHREIERELGSTTQCVSTASACISLLVMVCDKWPSQGNVRGSSRTCDKLFLFIMRQIYIKCFWRLVIAPIFTSSIFTAFMLIFYRLTVLDFDLLASTMRTWDIHTRRHLRTFEGHSLPVFSSAWAPDGRIVLSGSLDNTLKTYDVGNGTIIHTFHGHSTSVDRCLFSPDGEIICSTAQDGFLKLWKTDTGVCIKSFKFDIHGEIACINGTKHRKVWGIRFSDDGSFVKCSSGAFSHKVWNIQSGLVRNIFDPTPTDARPEFIHCSCVSPEGTCVFWSWSASRVNAP
jgi:hypothetical protein